MNALVIPYRACEPTGRNGIALDGTTLLLRYNSTTLATHPAPADCTMGEVLASYAPLAAWPQVTFSYTPPQTREYDIDMLVDISSHEEADGTIRAQGSTWVWEAARVAAPVAGTPGWDHIWGGPVDRRWGFRLDPALTGGDPVLWARLAAAIEEILLAYELGRDYFLPQRRRLDNMFSHAVPPWPQGCPPNLDDPDRGALPPFSTPATPVPLTPAP